MDTERWLAYGECADGTIIERAFPYTGYNTYVAEQDAAHDIETWLIEVACEEHGGCEFYSVAYTDCYESEFDCPEYNYKEEV